MYPFQTLISPLSVFISFTTMGGVAIHDTNVDKAVSTAMTYSVVAAADTKPGNDPHTHSERGSLSQSVRDLKTASPRLQPRHDNKKHMLQKHAVRGHHPFDNYNLPLV